MNIVTTAEMIEFERKVIASGTTAADLMEQAGRGMARIIQAQYPHSREALIVAGKGNNGGDGLVVARHLAAAGWNVRVAFPEGESNLRDLPREQLQRLAAEYPQVMIHPQLHATLFPTSHGLVIDALLGVGTKGKPKPALAKAIALINNARMKFFFRTVALDVPSGLSSDSNSTLDLAESIAADLTITVGFVKDFLVREAFADRVGRLEVVRLFSDTLQNKDKLLVSDFLVPLLPRRSPLSHKNIYGRALIVGGSLGFTGAPVMAANAALRIGSGLTNLSVDKTIYPIVAAHTPPEVMVTPRTLDEEFVELIEKATAIAIGPGLGTDSAAHRVLAFVLKHAEVPIIIDADALTLLAAKPALFKTTKAALILTPHPGEMKRLLGREFTLDERPAVARELSDKRNCVVVLKGMRTVIAAPGQPLYYNSTGNPGLAVGGSGDTLTGIIVGLLAQGLAPSNAARLGVWLHGRAADIALTERGCEEGLLPSDVCASLHHALTSLRYSN